MWRQFQIMQLNGQREPLLVNEDNLANLLSTKPPLARAELRDVVDLSLWAGQLLLQHGAEAERVEETVHRMATGLGCDWADIFISSSAIVMTTYSNHEFRTSIRRIPHLGVNKTIIAEINNLSRYVATGQIDRFDVRQQLKAISQRGHQYNRWLIVTMVGLACAAFSQLFGGDWSTFFVTWVAAGTGMVTRQELTKRHFNPILVALITAHIASLIASTVGIFNLSPNPEIALMASVLLLVPGVPLVNAFEDMLKGYVVIGMARAATATQSLLAIALGLLLTLFITGISL